MAEDTSGEQWPIPIERAAERLHCGVRWLKEHCKRHGLGRRAGKAIIFSAEEFDLLYASLPQLGAAGARAPLAASAGPSAAAVSARLAKHLAGKKGRAAKPRQGRRGPRRYAGRVFSHSNEPGDDPQSAA